MMVHGVASCFFIKSVCTSSCVSLRLSVSVRLRLHARLRLFEDNEKKFMKYFMKLDTIFALVQTAVVLGTAEDLAGHGRDVAQHGHLAGLAVLVAVGLLLHQLLNGLLHVDHQLGLVVRRAAEGV